MLAVYPNIKKGSGYLSNDDTQDKPVIDYPWLNSFDVNESSDESIGVILSYSSSEEFLFNNFYLSNRTNSSVLFDCKALTAGILPPLDYRITIAPSYSDIKKFSNNFLMGIFYSITNNSINSLLINNVDCTVTLDDDNAVLISPTDEIILLPSPGVNSFEFYAFH